MRQALSHTALSFAGLFLIGMMWGTTIPLTKVAVSAGYRPLGIIFWQFVCAILILGAVLLLRGERPPVTRKHLVYYCAIALIGTIVPNSFSILATSHLPAGIMSVLIATVPMFSLGVALAMGNERMRLTRVGGIVLGASALMLMALPEASLPDPAKWPFLIVGLVAPLCYGLEGNVVARYAPRRVSSIAVLWSASVIGALIAGPLAWSSGQWIGIFRPWTAADWAVLGSSTAHAFAYSGYLWLVGLAGVVFTSQVSYVVTATAVAVSILFLGESYSAWVWLAMGLILAGLALVQPVGRLPDTDAGDAV